MKKRLYRVTLKIDAVVYESSTVAALARAEEYKTSILHEMEPQFSVSEHALHEGDALPPEWSVGCHPYSGGSTGNCLKTIEEIWDDENQ